MPILVLFHDLFYYQTMQCCLTTSGNMVQAEFEERIKAVLRFQFGFTQYDHLPFPGHKRTFDSLQLGLPHFRFSNSVWFNTMP